MIDKLVEFGKKLRNEDSHDAIRYEPIHIAIIIDETGNFLEFIPQPENSKTISEVLSGSKKGKARLLVDKVEETLAFDEKNIFYISKN